MSADRIVARNPLLYIASTVTTNAKKDRRHSNTMTENGIDIQTITTNRIDFQADHVLLLGQVTEKKEKANLSHFFKFLLASHTNGTFDFAPTHKANASQNQKSRFFAHAQRKNSHFVPLWIQQNSSYQWLLSRK